MPRGCNMFGQCRFERRERIMLSVYCVVFSQTSHYHLWVSGQQVLLALLSMWRNCTQTHFSWIHTDGHSHSSGSRSPYPFCHVTVFIEPKTAAGWVGKREPQIPKSVQSHFDWSDYTPGLPRTAWLYTCGPRKMLHSMPAPSHMPCSALGAMPSALVCNLPADISWHGAEVIIPLNWFAV